MNTADYLLETGADRRPVIVTDKGQHTYHELREASGRVCAELAAHGVGPGDRVGLLAQNSLFWVAAYLAAMKLSAVAVPFGPSLLPSELPNLHSLVRCKVLCIEQRQQARYTFPAELPLVFESVLAQSGTHLWPATSVTAQSVAQDAALMFTSGTTAQPKAVRITHRNIQANTESIIEYLGLTETERIMVILPFSYCFGTSLLHTHLRVGGTLVLSNTFAYPETTLNLLEAAQCTGFAGVRSTYQTLLRNSTFTKRACLALHKLQQAGGKLSEVLIKELVAAAPQAEAFVMYGQTEATARLSYLPPARLGDKLGSIGRGIHGVTLRVLNDEGVAVTPGETGEIWANGENISPGYLDDPQATAERFPGGDLRTGDVATVDSDGFIFITDRKSHFIKSFGYRISSQQLESHVLELPEVISATAVGEPDEVCGEAIKVFVTLRAGSALTPQAIIQHCGQNLARHMIPKEVVIVDSLPLNGHGKIVKSKL